MEERVVYVLDYVPDPGVVCRVHHQKGSTTTGCTRSRPCEVAAFLRSGDAAGLSAGDRRLLMRLVMQRSLSRRAETVLRGSDGYSVFAELVASGRCFWYRNASRPLRWEEARRAVPTWHSSGHDLCAPRLDIVPAPTDVLPLIPPVYIDTRSLVCGEIACDLPGGAAAAWAVGYPMAPPDASGFVHQLMKTYPGADIPLPETVALWSPADATPVPCLTLCLRDVVPRRRRIASPATARQPVLRLEFQYGGQRLSGRSSDETVTEVGDEGLLRYPRDGQAEARARARLRERGLVPHAADVPESMPSLACEDWTLPAGEHSEWADIISAFLPELESEGWTVGTHRGLRLVAVDDGGWYSNLERSGSDWFNFEAGVVVDGRKVNLLPVIHHLLQQNRGRPLHQIADELGDRALSVPVADGAIALVPGQRVAMVLRCLFELMDAEPLDHENRLRLNAWRAAEISELEVLAQSPWRSPDSVRDLASRLKEGAAVAPRDPPEGFRGRLRGYQCAGLGWLRYLREKAFDGILADDMGLGKTVQVLAHLLAEKRAGRLDIPCLVVAPTSLMSNWRNEAERFAPDLRVLLLHGPDRKARFDRIDDCDLVLTTYALLRWDAEIYRDREFAYAILDEAQFIKNHQAQVARMARGLRSRRRLCLTGTPMENHLGELWSLFHFLMPGFLGSQRAFAKHFRTPIERDGNAGMQSILAARVSPFLMRRTKEEVTPELPPCTEMVRNVELTEKQQALYEGVRLAMEARIRQELQQKGLRRSHIVILHALLKLRQICCDPRLVDGEDSVASAHNSGKLTVLISMLPQLIEEGRGILLFSQFTRMLRLIEAEVERLGIPHVVLTGATRNRAAPIDRFQRGEVPLFLISLKAGGTGLNLTAADTVIHYDPWWNPAVENQATDRAHRIGQDKPVFVYKLIANGTVESRIVALQKQKQDLVDGILSEQSAGRFRFEQDDIEALFAPIG